MVWVPNKSKRRIPNEEDKIRFVGRNAYFSLMTSWRLMTISLYRTLDGAWWVLGYILVIKGETKRNNILSLSAGNVLKAATRVQGNSWRQLWNHFKDILSQFRVPQYKTKKKRHKFLNQLPNCLAPLLWSDDKFYWTHSETDILAEAWSLIPSKYSKQHLIGKKFLSTPLCIGKALVYD